MQRPETVLKAHMSDNVNSIAVMRGGAIGDFVLTLPAVRALARAYPGAYLRLIGSPATLRLAGIGNLLDQNSARLAPLYTPDAPLPPATRALFAGVDLLLAYAVDPDGVLGGRLRSAVPGHVILHDPRPDGTCHIVDHLLAPLHRHGIPVADPTPRIRLCETDFPFADAVWTEHSLHAPAVTIHPGSGGRRKRWPPDRYLDLAAALGRRGVSVLLLHGPAETDLIPRLQGSLPDGCISLRPPGNLRELAGLLARVDLFVGNDSGPGHIAAAVSTPTLTLFGPTDPRVWAPRGPHVRTLHAPGGQLDALPVGTVLETALDILHIP